MNIKDLLGDLYTPEIENKLNGKKLVDLSEGNYVSVDKYKSLEDDKKKVEAEKLTLSSELAKKEEANMSESEKIQKLIEETQKTKSQLIKDRNRFEAEKILTSAGLKEEDYSKYIDTIVSEDMDATKTIAQSIVDTIEGQRKLMEQKVKEDLAKEDTLPPAGNPKKEMTREEFNKLGYEGLVKLLQEDPETYKKFS